MKLTNKDELRALCLAAKGWNFNAFYPIDDESDCVVGFKSEDGEFSAVVTLDCETYDYDSKPLAEFMVAVNADTTLALLDEIAALKAELAAMREQKPVAMREQKPVACFIKSTMHKQDFYEQVYLSHWSDPDVIPLYAEPGAKP